MADAAHLWTDKKLEKMERRLSAIYSRADREVQETADEYFAKFIAMDERKKKLVLAGKLDPEEYKRWRTNKILYGERYRHLKDQIAKELLNANRTALDYINDQMPLVYSVNYNALAEAVDGVGGYSFTLVDPAVVKKLATEDETLLPYKYVDGERDVRWNTKKVNAEVLQGILQGDSIPKIAGRLQRVTEMNKVSAVRNARTAITSAECKGRQDSYVQAQKDGIRLQREWIATLDGRTRHSHRLLDGQIADVDQPFEVEGEKIMYPGDPTASPHLVYNCRCTTIAKIIGFGKKTEREAIKFESGEDAIKYFGQKPPRSLRRENKEKYQEQLKEYKENSQFGKWESQVTTDQERSVSEYCADGYSGINGYCRKEMTEKMVDSWNEFSYKPVSEVITNIDDAISNFELKDNISVFRTCEEDVFENLKKEKGFIFHDRGYVSTTVIDQSVASGNVKIEINVPSGKGHGAWVCPLSGSEEEYEFLLPRGSNFAVRDIEEKGGQTLIKMDWIGSEKDNLEFATRESVIERWKRLGIYDEKSEDQI